MKRNYFYFILPALIVICFDQISKLTVTGYIRYNHSVAVIENFFNLVHVRNRGMAFGLLNRPDPGFSFYILVTATIAAIILILFWFTTLKGKDKRFILGLSLILGGAIGNLIDRLRYREVIDFLDFYIGNYHWPSFNLADSSITIGALWIAINILFFSSDS